jgi:hypothetical protein
MIIKSVGIYQMGRGGVNRRHNKNRGNADNQMGGEHGSKIGYVQLGSKELWAKMHTKHKGNFPKNIRATKHALN